MKSDIEAVICDELLRKDDTVETIKIQVQVEKCDNLIRDIAIFSRDFERKVQEKVILREVLKAVGFDRITDIDINPEEGEIVAICEGTFAREDATRLCNQLNALLCSVIIDFPLNEERRTFHESFMNLQIDNIDILVIAEGCIQIKISNIVIVAAFCTPKIKVRIPKLTIPNALEMKSLSFGGKLMTFEFKKKVILK